MTDDDRVATRELMRSITVKDRRLRLATVVFMFVVALVLAGVIVLQYHQIQQSNANAVTRATNLQKILDGERAENAKQTRYIQCIAQFFANTDRATRILTDLDSCNIQSNGQTVPGVDLTPTSQSSSSGSIKAPGAAGSSLSQSTGNPQGVDDSGSGSPAGGATTNPLQGGIVNLAPIVDPILPGTQVCLGTLCLVK